MDSQQIQGMNDFTGQDLTLTVPLTLEAHQLAQEFCQHHPNPQKAKQVYLNTLAVYTVHAYLNWLGIETDLPGSHSWNPVLQALADTGDLEVKGWGKLECCPVLPDATVCHVSPEVWFDRVGYVVVQMDAALHEATLLGFAPSVPSGELPLQHLQPIDALLAQIPHLEPVQPRSISSRLGRNVVFLSQWFHNEWTQGWQAVEELLGLPQPELSFRRPELTAEPEFITRGKLVTLQAQAAEQQSEQQSEQQVALLVGLMPMDGKQFDIWVKLCPVNPQSYLPENLEMAVLDEQEAAVMQAQSRQTEMLQLKFRGVPGEQFSIKMVWNQATVVETFII